MDSETTTWEVLNHVVLKRISCKWLPLFACRAPERLQNGPSDKLEFLWCSRGPWLSSSFFRHTSRFLKFSTHNRMDFWSGTWSLLKVRRVFCPTLYDDKVFHLVCTCCILICLVCNCCWFCRVYSCSYAVWVLLSYVCLLYCVCIAVFLL